jgi:hypothetical protein
MLVVVVVLLQLLVQICGCQEANLANANDRLLDQIKEEEEEVSPIIQLSEEATGTATGITTDKRRLLPQARIVGGEEASPGEYPGFAYWDQGCG